MQFDHLRSIEMITRDLNVNDLNLAKRSHLLVGEHAAVVDELHAHFGSALLACARLLDATAVHPHLQGRGECAA